MDLSEYFKQTSGFGILSTADGSGRVDSAIFSKPFFEDEDTVLFVFYDRLSHRNLKQNPHATYLFLERTEKGYKGKRLFLHKIREEDDPAKIDAFFKERNIDPQYREESKFIVYLKIDSVHPVVEYHEHAGGAADEHWAHPGPVEFGWKDEEVIEEE